MSQENVAGRAQGRECLQRPRYRTGLSFIDPEIELRSGVEPEIFRGLDGVVEYRQAMDAVFEEFHPEEGQILDAGPDRVVHLYRIVGRGAGSGVPASQKNAILWHLRNGKLLKGRIYMDQQRALEAAALRE
jgi:ketosteroid isomerase-like protein